MKNLFIFAFVLATNFISFNSCSTNDNNVSGTVDFYLLEKFDTLHETQKIENAVIKSKPFIEYSDLLYYDKDNYTFKLSESAVNTLKDTHYRVSGLGFAVVANKKIVYTGYFWPSYSSAICNWIVADPLLLDKDNLTINLGYPNESFAKGIEDRRNDKLILDIFDRDNKLK